MHIHAHIPGTRNIILFIFTSQTDTTELRIWKAQGENSHLICDVSTQQHPDHSSTLWALHLQLVLRVVGQAVGILHRALLCIPSTRSNADISADQIWKQRDLYFSNCRMLHMSCYVQKLAFFFFFSSPPPPLQTSIQVHFWIKINLLNVWKGAWYLEVSDYQTCLGNCLDKENMGEKKWCWRQHKAWHTGNRNG